MKHRTGHGKLGRPSHQRRALLMSLAKSLVSQERIETTLTKAKVLRPFVERLISLGRHDTPGARQRLFSFSHDRAFLKKLTSELRVRYQNRPGGYTRIIKKGYRFGDHAPVALMELVDRPLPQQKKASSKKTTSVEESPK
ncbi:50S ribosomal protein L17 [Candidatus Hepatobacter penaei]|uniref:50S ribosomal protein L17 n=1 Tax=Candidatus Hepatobacter penaei TaxID=1274402 RepID=UPI0004F35209|nr:50S ribosomal protein L17 [Candidatus Hepatobacter penaei]TGW15912.1 50S ribosomal protein L17 [bacterium NHP-B]